MFKPIKLPYTPYEVPDSKGNRIKLSDKARRKLVDGIVKTLNLRKIKFLIDSGVPRFYHPVSGILLSAEASQAAAKSAYTAIVDENKALLDDMRILQTLELIHIELAKEKRAA